MCCAQNPCCVFRFEGAEAAHSIISGGPEPLQSQFTTSYSLVLNLLSVYSLEEAREFLRCVYLLKVGQCRGMPLQC